MYIPCLIWYWIIGLRGLVVFLGLYPIESTGVRLFGLFYGVDGSRGPNALATYLAYIYNVLLAALLL